MLFLSPSDKRMGRYHSCLTGSILFSPFRGALVPGARHRRRPRCPKIQERPSPQTGSCSVFFGRDQQSRDIWFQTTRFLSLCLRVRSWESPPNTSSSFSVSALPEGSERVDSSKHSTFAS